MTIIGQRISEWLTGKVTPLGHSGLASKVASVENSDYSHQLVWCQETTWRCFAGWGACNLLKSSLIPSLLLAILKLVLFDVSGVVFRRVKTESQYCL